MPVVKKASKSEKKNEKSKEYFSIDSLIKNKYQILFSILVFIVLMALYFSPLYFKGKVLVSGDILNGESYKNYYASPGIGLWDPYVFCGMPGFGKIGWYDTIGNFTLELTKVFSNFFNFDYVKWTLYFLFLGLFVFLLMRHLKARLTVAIFVAVSTMFSTGILLLFNIGHVTKLLSLITFPLVLLFLLKFNEKIKLLDVLLFILTMHFLFMQWHVQIIFYIFFTVAVFYLYYFLHSFITKNSTLRVQIIKSAFTFIIISVVALGMNYYKLKQIYEYTPYSTRGTKSIVDVVTKSSEKTAEEFYQYATNWSFSPGEVMTFLFPSYYGFGHSTYNGPLTNNEDYPVNTYFGQMPFVDVAQYMGVIIFALGLFTIIRYRKQPFVQFLTVLIIISMLLSFGRNFSILYDLFFHYVPFFDKFRAPSMILNLVQLSLPVLAGIGLMNLFDSKQQKNNSDEKIFKILGIVSSVLLLISIISSQALSNWFKERIAESGQVGQQLKPLYDYMSSMFTGDVFIAFLLISITFWLIYLFIKGKFGFDGLVIILSILSLADLWRIDIRGTEYGDASVINQRFEMPDYIKAIKSSNDNQPHRLLNIKQDKTLGALNQHNNYHVYFLEEDLFGYSGIKPRSFQDIMDIIGPINLTLWRMLNVKYIISQSPVNASEMTLIQNSDNTYTYRNENALPRAYFVNEVKVAKPLEILNNIKNNSFDPLQVAFVEDQQINVDSVGKDASLNFTYAKEELYEMQVNATGNNLLFFGNTYIPVGWKATIDDKPTNIYKVNHGFMGIVVPKGSHKVQFLYHPDTFYTGRIITLILNLLLILGIIFSLIEYRKVSDAA